MSHVPRALYRVSAALLLATVPLMTAPALAQFFPEQEPGNDELVFGCDPGPIEPFVHHDPPVPPRPVPDEDTPPGSTIGWLM